MNSISIRVNLCRAACQQLKLWPWLMASINSAASYYSSFFKCFRNFIKAALNCKCVSLPRPSVLLSILLLSLVLRSSCRIVSCHLELIIYSSGQLAVLLNWWALWLAGKEKWRYVGRGWETDFNLRILFVISACLINVSLLWWCWSFACCVDLLVNATWTSVLAKAGRQGKWGEVR